MFVGHADLTFYPLDKPLLSYSGGADCNGGTRSEIWSRRKVRLGHSDALMAQVDGQIASARQRVDMALRQSPPRHALARCDARRLLDAALAMVVGGGRIGASVENFLFRELIK